MIYYQDNEIKIRDICNEDVISLFSWSIDKEINKHDPRPLPCNSSELVKECAEYCKRFDDEVMNENVNNIKYKFFIITNKKDQAIGFVNFFSIDKIKRQGEMGISLGDKRYWRKGIAYRAINAVIDYIFKEMDIERVYIETGEANIPALKLFEKLNFIKCDEYLEEDNFKFIVMEKTKKCRW